MQYAEVIVAVIGALALAALADQLTGKRGFGGTTLVAGVGAICGWFLAVRVFAVSTLTDWTWVVWSMIGAVICLVAFFLFRSKR